MKRRKRWLKKKKEQEEDARRTKKEELRRSKKGEEEENLMILLHHCFFLSIASFLPKRNKEVYSSLLLTSSSVTSSLLISSCHYLLALDYCITNSGDLRTALILLEAGAELTTPRDKFPARFGRALSHFDESTARWSKWWRHHDSLLGFLFFRCLFSSICITAFGKSRWSQFPKLGSLVPNLERTSLLWSSDPNWERSKKEKSECLPIFGNFLIWVRGKRF